MREILETLLTREGYSVRLAASRRTKGSSWRGRCRSTPSIVDVMMPGMDGLQCSTSCKKIDDELPVIMITAFASVETAIAAMKQGAFDYITKPFKNDEVLVVAQQRRRAPPAGRRERRAQAEPAGALPQVRRHHRHAARG